MPMRPDTVPLPLALHLAGYAVIGLFCSFAGGLNLIDPTKIIWHGIAFLGIAGFSWGYVFGIFMGRAEALILGFFASGVAMGWAGFLLGRDPLLAGLLGLIGAYGFVALRLGRRWVLGLY